MMWRSALTKTSNRRRAEAVDQDEPGHRIDDVVIADIEPPWPPRPAEPGIEDQQPDEAEPENRDGIAEQTRRRGSPDPASVPDWPPRRRRAARRARREDRRQGRELECRREEMGDVGEHRFEVSTERPRSPCSHLVDIEIELLIERQIETELDAGALIDLGGRPVADRREHGSIGITRRSRT